MATVVTKSRLGSEFDDFLFTQLGEDRNGLPLSVVSLFARLDLDPWQEAGILVALDAEEAGKRLSCTLATLTDPALQHVNSEMTVRRLLALLPSHKPVARAPFVGTGGGSVPPATLATRPGR